MTSATEPLRRWLYFLANESTDVPEFLGSVVEDVLEKSPDAYRAIDIVANQRRWAIRSDGARAGQLVSAQQIYSRLSELPETPEAVKQVCGAIDADGGTGRGIRIARKFVQSTACGRNRTATTW